MNFVKNINMIEIGTAKGGSMKIINVPIEPLEERYSAQWDTWFCNHLAVDIIDYDNVYGRKYEGIKDGSFLDVVQTNIYKATQLRKICKILTKKEFQTNSAQDVVVFFQDIWFPGLEMLAYIRDGIGLKFKICGCLHAGTYDPNDFLAKQGMGKWGEKLEESWFEIVDAIFVATEYHRDLIKQRRKIAPHKIHVTGFPIYADEIDHTKGIKKENIIVFPHRLDEEKRPDLFGRLKEECKCMKEFKGWVWLKSKDACRNKKEYYELLARSKIAISFAEQETWGIAMQEAVFNGCYPIVPDKLSYSKMYERCFRYNDWKELLLTLELCMKTSYTPHKEFDRNKKYLSDKGKQAIPNMINIMKLL